MSVVLEYAAKVSYPGWSGRVEVVTGDGQRDVAVIWCRIHRARGANQVVLVGRDRPGGPWVDLPDPGI